MRTLGALVWVVLAATQMAAQVNQNVWVASWSAVYEVSPTGAIVGNYPAPCYGAVSPCQFRTARDQLGSVYVATVTYFAPGVGGSLKQFQTGTGGTVISSGGFSAVAVDAAGDLWWAELNYSSYTMGVVNTTVARGTVPFAGPTHSAYLPGNFTFLEPHPVSGVWASDGVTLSRLHTGPGSSVITSPSMSLPGLTALAADGLGRVWAYQQSTSQLLRVVENASGLAVDWTQVIAGVETIVVDRSNQVLVHVVGTNGLSSLVRFGADGTPISTTSYPVRVRTIDVDVHGGIWGQYRAAGGALSLLHQDVAGVLTVTALSPSTAVFDTFATHGDTTGSIFARLGPPGVDSDGDGSPNRVEVLRGTDPFSLQSAPPVVTITPVAGSSPPAYTIGYSDPDPAHAGFAYVLGCALSTTTGIAAGPYGGNPTFPLDLDPVLALSLAAAPPTFVNFSGVMSPGGLATALLTLPQGTPSGVTVSFAGVTLSPAGACLASSNAVVLITP